MALLDVVVLGETAGAVGAPALALVSLSSVGLLGVTDWILGEEAEEPEESATDGGNAMFDEQEPVGDGAGAGAGDEFAFDDAGGGEAGGDAFDDFDMGGMDDEEGGAAGGAGAGVADLERRVEEMEEELSSLSSTVSTVRTENEQIGDSVEDIEENIRKLLDIYKMVTKGVNPFVDQEGGENVSAAVDGNTLGLFDEEDESESSDADLEDDVAEADAEEFFDDDFEDEEAGSFEEDEQETEDDQATDEDQDMAQSEDAETAQDTGDGGAKSFDELREEYEEGADWSEGEEAEDDASEEEESAEEPDEVEAEAVEPEDEADVDDERVDALFEEDEEQAADATDQPPQDAHPEEYAEPRDSVEPRPDPRQRARPQPRTQPRQQQRAQTRGERERPYLREVPGGYVADLIVMEWIEFLVTESTVDGAHRAITYYENVEWVGRRAADQLRAFVDGHPEARLEIEEDTPLTMEHHQTSLRYIARLNGDLQENVLNSWAGGENSWLQHHQV